MKLTTKFIALAASAVMAFAAPAMALSDKTSLRRGGLFRSLAV